MFVYLQERFKQLQAGTRMGISYRYKSYFNIINLIDSLIFNLQTKGFINLEFAEFLALLENIQPPRKLCRSGMGAP
jgi:hypothetical protein